MQNPFVIYFNPSTTNTIKKSMVDLSTAHRLKRTENFCQADFHSMFDPIPGLGKHSPSVVRSIEETIHDQGHQNIYIDIPIYFNISEPKRTIQATRIQKRAMAKYLPYHHFYGFLFISLLFHSRLRPLLALSNIIIYITQIFYKSFHIKEYNINDRTPASGLNKYVYVGDLLRMLRKILNLTNRPMFVDQMTMVFSFSYLFFFLYFAAINMVRNGTLSRF